MKVLVVSEWKAGRLNPISLSAITAASSLQPEEVDVLLAGQANSDDLMQLRSIEGVSRVKQYHTGKDNLTAEDWCEIVSGIANDYSHIIAASSSFSKDWLPRVSGVLACHAVTDVIKIISKGKYMRPIYAGNAIETLELLQHMTPLTIRPTAFAAANVSETVAELEECKISLPSQRVSFVSGQEASSDGPDLTSAKVVVSGGRGVGSRENFEMIEELASALGAAVGASRAAVDAEYVPNDYQVGQTGKIIAPDLYIAIGISGAIQHLAGMKDSKVIMAINKDEEAPIFGVADYGLVGDLHEIVPVLLEKIKTL